MLTKAQSKYIRSLAEGRERRAHERFVVEGSKMCTEWLQSSAGIDLIVCTEAWAAVSETLLTARAAADRYTVPSSVLAGLSTLSSPPDVLLVVRLSPPPARLPQDGWCLALDTIQDPGNLGTILRIADWFGIPAVVCSPGCADAYSPKVVQAGMGAHLRVSIHTAGLLPFIESTQLPVLAAVLDGESVAMAARLEEAVLLIGNESRGLSADLLAAATRRVTIPRHGGAESLNAAVSTGILCAMLMEH